MDTVRLSDYFYWTWYDQQSPGFTNWVLVSNPNIHAVYLDIIIFGTVGLSALLTPGESVTTTFPGRKGGPVEVLARGDRIAGAVPADVVAPRRVTFGPSFGETIGYRSGDLKSNYHWTWCDNQTPGMTNWILVYNPSSVSSITYTVIIGGTPVPGYINRPPEPETVETPTFPGIMAGPVEIHSLGGVIVTSQRVLYNGYFNEVSDTELN